ncbi:unnamed protein product [Lymnaea stagnalis]|uniref:RRM domain-containing protein n=1 Tax=Lymnaea stagnalis TaxID=6523 RepID=A0AAV2H110_LYMST
MNHKISKNVQATMPCGNPKRYDTRDVVRMPQGSSQNKGSDGIDSTETASERHLQTLLQRQVRKDITLADHFSQHRSFSLATSHAPGVEKLVGIHNFEHYKVVNDLDSKVDYLRHCGLDDEEITIMLQEEMKIEVTLSHRYGADPAYKAEKLSEIKRKIVDKEKSLQIPDKFQGALELSRQDRDLDRSITKKYRQDSGIPSIITTEKKFVDSHPDDPINHIPEILNVINGKIEREPRRDRRKRRKLEKRQQYYSSLNSADEEEKESSDVPDSSHHVDMSPPNSELPSQSDTQLIISDTTVANNINLIDAGRKSVSSLVPKSSNDISQNEVTDVHNEVTDAHNEACSIIEECKGSRIVNEFTQTVDPNETGTNNGTHMLREIEVPVQILTREEIENNRLTIDEIKAIDKFQNYSVGDPKKIVYVKNLHNKVTERDLVSLFGSFQSVHKSKLVFKLLSGRMKGQAFITFPDEVTAGEAIKLVNGYKLKDKPVIATFGRKH